MNKQIKVVLRGEAKDSFEELNSIVLNQIKNKIKGSFEIKLLKSIKDKIEILKLNPFYGDPIRKNLIPKKLMLIWKKNLELL